MCSVPSRDRVGAVSSIWYLPPVMFLFWLYAGGLRTWFVADDFAWLGLLRQVDGFRNFLRVMFAPEAQGTFRFLSERGFFLLLERVFGLESVPFRLFAFTTVAADTVLISWVTRRITGSRLAALLAPLLWLANPALAPVMAWNSAYNEALCPLFLLGALALFIRFADSGRWVFWWWQLVVFTLGFGALEINTLYPALATVWILAAGPEENRKRLLRSQIPLFGISAGYFLLHRAVAPFMTEGPYAFRIDRTLFKTFATYFRWTFVSHVWLDLGNPRKTGRAVVWILAAALAIFCFREIAKKRYFVIFFVTWFLITLAPMLPLPNHITDYYLTIPVIGLAMLGGAALSHGWRSNWAWRLVAILPLTAYLTVALPSSRFVIRWWVDRSRPVRALVLGVAAAEQTHPGKVIVLDSVPADVYNASFAASAFTETGLGEVYLAPGALDTLHPINDDSGKLRHIALEPVVLWHAITHHDVVVYSPAGDHLRNVTNRWARNLGFAANDPQPRHIEAGSPLFSWLFGPEWLPPEDGARWMPQQATVHLGGPQPEEETLVIEGFCDRQLYSGPVHLNVSADGIRLTGKEINEVEGDFRRRFTLPALLVGRRSMDVVISADRAVVGQADSHRGVLISTITIER